MSVAQPCIPMKEHDLDRQLDDDDSRRRALEDCLQQRREFTAQTGIPLTPDGRMILPAPGRVAAMPIRDSRLALVDRLSCSEVMDRAVETYGVQEVIRSLALVLCANGIDIATQTINELAQVEERS